MLMTENASSRPFPVIPIEKFLSSSKHDKLPAEGYVRQPELLKEGFNHRLGFRLAAVDEGLRWMI
jgi:hypothetical protein